MHKKYFTVFASIALTLVLVGAGCTSSKISSETEDTTNPNPPSVVLTGQTKEFNLSAKNWQFDPSTITVNQGDKVRLIITSVDVAHSFMLKDFNLNVKLEPKETQTVEFIADKTGSFQFRCGIPCGDGHRDMIGTFIVK